MQLPAQTLSLNVRQPAQSAASEPVQFAVSAVSGDTARPADRLEQCELQQQGDRATARGSTLGIDACPASMPRRAARRDAHIGGANVGTDVHSGKFLEKRKVRDKSGRRPADDRCRYLGPETPTKSRSFVRPRSKFRSGGWNYVSKLHPI